MKRIVTQYTTQIDVESEPEFSALVMLTLYNPSLPAGSFTAYLRASEAAALAAWLQKEAKKQGA